MDKSEIRAYLIEHRPTVDVICRDRVFRAQQINYVPNHSNMSFSLSPDSAATGGIFQAEREYIGEDDDTHPEFFSFGEPGPSFPDPGTFHCFRPQDIVALNGYVLMIADIDMEIG